jgi:hypothetical protein
MAGRGISAAVISQAEPSRPVVQPGHTGLGLVFVGLWMLQESAVGLQWRGEGGGCKVGTMKTSQQGLGCLFRGQPSLWEIREAGRAPGVGQERQGDPERDLPRGRVV